MACVAVGVVSAARVVASRRTDGVVGAIAGAVAVAGAGAAAAAVAAAAAAAAAAARASKHVAVRFEFVICQSSPVASSLPLKIRAGKLIRISSFVSSKFGVRRL